MNRCYGRWIATFAVLAAMAASEGAAQDIKKITTIEGITEYHLKNGMRVLLYPDESKPTVTVNLTLFVGSRHEGYGEAGMAHLLEHMLFKGTPTHPQVPKVLQDRGARFNGTTWLDRTNYYETLPASDENLEFAIRLEADRMINSYIKGSDLASEMTVVRNEFERGENSPTRILRQKMFSVAYEWHNYGKSTIGNRSDIERVPLPKLRAFYRRYYQPDNAMLVVAGRFDAKKALGFVQKYFGTIPRPERKLDNTYTEEPAQDGERMVTLRRVGDVGLVGVAYHIPAGAHPDFAAVDVLGTLLTTEPAGRLYKTLVETKQATNVGGGAFALHDPGLMYFGAEVRKDKSLEEVRDTMIYEIERIGKDGVTKEEVTRVQQQLLKQRELSLNRTSSVAIDLSEWAAQGDWRLFFLYRDRIEKVTPKDVQRVAAKYLAGSNRTVGLFIPSDKPERTPVPATPDLLAMVKDYKGRETVAAGEQFDPSPKNIDARTTRFELASGLKVAILPKKTRGESVNLSVNLRYGNEENLKGLHAAASILPTLMTRGTKQMTYQELQDTLDKNRVVLGGSGGLGAASFSIRTKRPQLLTALELLRQVLREPALPEEEFEVLRRQQLARLESSKSEPMALGPIKVRQTVSPYPKGHVRYTPSVAESLERYNTVSLSQVQQLYNEYLGGTNGELVIVGDFSPKEIRPLLEKTFDSWVAKMPYARIKRQVFKVPGSAYTIETPDKANSLYFAGLVFSMDDTNELYPGTVIGNYILGGGSLSSRLGNRVRQKDGLSYTVRSSFSAYSLDPVSQFSMYAICNPQNMTKVVKAFREEIDLLLKDGITDEELMNAKDGFLRSASVGRTNDGTLASMLASTLYTGRTMQYTADFENKIKALTKDDVVKALRKNLKPDNIVYSTAGDFKKAEESKEKK